MTCSKIKKNISFYIDGRLTEKDLLVFEEHISRCADCRKILEETKMAIRMISGVPAQPLPDGFYQRLDKKLEQEPEATRLKTFNWNYLTQEPRLIVRTEMKKLKIFLRQNMRAYPVRYVSRFWGENMKRFFVEFRKQSRFLGLISGAATIVVLLLVFVIVKETNKITRKFDQPVSQFAEQSIAKQPAIPQPSLEIEKFKKEENIPTPQKQDLSIDKNKIAGKTELPSKTISEDKSLAETISAEKELPVAKEEVAMDKIVKNVEREDQTFGFTGTNEKRRERNLLGRNTRQEIAPQKAAETATMEWRGYYSGYKDRLTEVIKDENFWIEFWGMHTGNQEPAPDLPQIDFTKQMVIAVFMGEQNSGGYRVEITKIEKRRNKIIVQYRETFPPPQMMVPMVLTQPYHIKVIEKSDLPVVFEKIK